MVLLQNRNHQPAHHGCKCFGHHFAMKRPQFPNGGGYFEPSLNERINPWLPSPLVSHFSLDTVGEGGTSVFKLQMISFMYRTTINSEKASQNYPSEV